MVMGYYSVVLGDSSVGGAFFYREAGVDGIFLSRCIMFSYFL